MAQMTWDDFPVADQGPLASPPARPEKPREAPPGYEWDGSGGMRPVPGGPADPAAPQNQPKPDANSGKPSATEIELGAKKESAEKRGNTVRAMLTEVRRLYDQDIKGQPVTRAFGATEYIDKLPRNERFTAAGNSILPLIRPLVAQTAKEGDSDKEMTVFMAYVPTADDADMAIEQKLKMLEALIGGMVDGKSPSDLIRDFGIQPGQMVDFGDGLEGGSVTDDRPPDGGGPNGNGSGPGLSLDTIATGVGQGAGDIVEGFGDMLGMVLNPVNTAIGRAAGYDNYTSDFGTTLRETTGLPDNPNGFTSAVNKGATAALTGSGLARGASMLASAGPVQNALARFASTPGRDMAAGAGAGAGGEIGREIGGTGGQIAGTLAGGMAGYSGVNAMMRAGVPRTPSPLAQTAARQNVDLLPADAGGRAAGAITAGTKASPLSVAPVVKAAQKQQGQMSQAARRAADSQGEVVTTDIAGQNVRNAAERFSRDTSKRGSDLYDKANKAAGGAKIEPFKAVRTIDDQLARLNEIPETNAPLIGALEKLKRDISGGVSVTGLRDARTALSQGVYDGKLRSNQEKAVYKQILDALSGDIDRGLRSSGRTSAAVAFKKADAFWRDRVEHIDEVLQPILGKDKSGEQIVAAVEGMAKGQGGGNARLSRLLANMEPQEAGQVRATIIDRLGKATPGAQDAEGTAYSASTFLTNWNKMTPQAKASLFSDKALRNDLNDIATLAEGMKTSQSMTNFSNTAGAIGSNVAGAVLLTMAHPLAAILGAGAQYATGRLMASPKFARMLASTVKMPPEAAAKSITQRLATIAANDNAIASDAKALGAFLTEQFGKSPGRAAADDPADSRRIPPQ